MSVRIDGDELFIHVMTTDQVEAAVYSRAAKIAAKARRLDVADGKGAARIRVEPVLLPSGRAACNVVSDDVEGEYGTSTSKQLRTLRRAAGGA